MLKQNIMNFLKKNYTKIILFTAVLSFLISLTVIIIKRNNREIVIVNYLQNYIINDKYYEIGLNVYSSEKAIEFFDESLITSTSLTDSNQLTNFCHLKLTSITCDKKSEKEYNYKIKFDFPILGNSVAYFENVELNIEVSDKTLSIPLGNIIFVPAITNNILNITRIKGIVNKVNNMELLAAVVVDFGKDSDIRITNIDVLMPYMSVSTRNIKEVSYDNILNDTEISQIIPNYNIFNSETKQISIKLNKEENSYLVPFTYHKQFFTNQAAVIVEFEYQGSLYKEIIPPYCYFNSSINYNEEYKQVL